jgi:hypothetical protein
MKLKLFLVFAILSNAVMAFNPFIAKYELTINGIPIATETRILNQFGSDYVYTANAKTSGLAKLLGNISIEARSLFSINDSGVNAQSYFINENKGDKLVKSYAINISSKNNMALSTSSLSNPVAIISKSKGGNIVDSLSLFLALSQDLQKYPNKTIFDYQVADGKSIEQQQYKRISNETINVGNKPTDVIKVTKIGSNGNIQAFFSPKYQYLPVLIEKKRGNKNYNYKIIQLKINKKSTKNLQVSF